MFHTAKEASVLKSHYDLVVRKRLFPDQNSGMEGTTRKIDSFSNRPAKTDVQKGSRDSQSLFFEWGGIVREGSETKPSH